ncbi:hypothetical protein TNCV_1011121 [Trichonephila clavipes]|uniref:Uncharacterized protein n=1 Tax=Trichonephila clavipes TaxID=2585209 RepID=A0A8X6VX34_TRICX|nr:hypothetical protein TNCV_1011121 [Trichonephila clavipes]
MRGIFQNGCRAGKKIFFLNFIHPRRIRAPESRETTFRACPPQHEKISVLRKNKIRKTPAGLFCPTVSSEEFVTVHDDSVRAAQNYLAGKECFWSCDEAYFWLNGYVNKQNCRIWSEANPQVYVETPLHPEKLTVWCALWAGGILLQKR